MKCLPNSNASNDISNVIYYNPFYSKTIHHTIMTPSMLGLVEKPLVVGAPSTSQIKNEQTAPVIAPTVVKRKVGRPRNDSKRPIVEKDVDPFEEDDLISHRTKSGRIVKLNPEIAKIFQSEPASTFSQPQIQVPTVVQTPATQAQPMPSEPKLLPGLTEPPTKKPRKISSEFRCTTCKKIYLGKNKMNNHFKLFPDHRPKTSEAESVLFSHLMTMVRQKRKNKDMADVFFKEISNFVQHCEKLTPRLITNKDNHPNTHHHIVDKNAASLLRINPGNYRLNMNVFDKSFKLDNPVEEEPEEPHEIVLDSSDNHDDHHEDIHETAPSLVNGNEVIKALDAINVPSLDGNEVNLLIRQTNELTNLTNISDIVGETEKIDDGDNALLGF